MTQAILSSEDHAARAVVHQNRAATYAAMAAVERDNGRDAALWQVTAARQAAHARFHLFRAIDIRAEG